jgi:phage anti-repressor protein
MTAPTLIPVLPGTLGGRSVQLVDARLLHDFMESRQDFSDWIKNRIRRYAFEEGSDYLHHKIMEQVPHMKGLRTRIVMEYHLTLDMAKELAMVERTPKGRQARRYFIDCERQLKAMRERSGDAPAASYPLAIDLLNADISSINRQAWADVAGENTARFHARREVLLRQQRELRIRAMHRALRTFDRPVWAQ